MRGRTIAQLRRAWEGRYAADEAGDPALDMLLKSVPGAPGEDYPIYAEVPETAFSCDGQVDGGKNRTFKLLNWHILIPINTKR